MGCGNVAAIGVVGIGKQGGMGNGVKNQCWPVVRVRVKASTAQQRENNETSKMRKEGKSAHVCVGNVTVCTRVRVCRVCGDDVTNNKCVCGG